jgi:GR25 family glycosyltransferase involved in LPS biosynthesis
MIEIKKCFYLNLDRRTDRKRHIENEISKTNLVDLCERFPAINGLGVHPRDLPEGLITQNALEDILSDTITAWGLSITQGGLGVLLSYLEMFKIISKLDGSVIIFEDDTVISDDFNIEMNKVLTELPDDYDICYLGHGDIKVKKTPFSDSLSIPKGMIVCLPGLIVSPNGASKMLNLLKNIDNQFDTALYNILPKLNAFVSNKLIAQVKNQFQTDIQGNNSCKKEYVKQNYIMSTLAYGEGANQNAMKLARDLKFFNQDLIVVTNKEGFFNGMSNVIEIKYPGDVFSYNKKIICIEEGLKRQDAVVYIDSDARMFYETYKNAFTNFFVNIKPGFHVSWDWGKITREDSRFFTSKDVRNRIPGYGEMALELATQLDIDIDSASHYQEGIIIVSKDNGKEEMFLDIWKLFAERLDSFEFGKGVTRLGVGEGNLIGLALTASGIKINGPEMCNLFGENLKYNFWGIYKQDYIKNFPNRKIVKSSENTVIFENETLIDFDNRKVSLSYVLSEIEPGLLSIVFEWNKNNAVEFLDHEFKIGDEVYHFNSDKNNEFYFENRPNLIIEHTYDWYGQRNWTELSRHE